jgi:hypothetical protein
VAVAAFAVVDEFAVDGTFAVVVAVGTFDVDNFVAVAAGDLLAAVDTYAVVALDLCDVAAAEVLAVETDAVVVAAEAVADVVAVEIDADADAEEFAVVGKFVT